MLYTHLTTLYGLIIEKQKIFQFNTCILNNKKNIYEKQNTNMRNK